MISNVADKLEWRMQESQNQRDARVEQLWRKLDFQNAGELDWKGLQKGLRRIDHPLKNADDMLKDIIKVVDTDGDGKIQYEEFRVFVEAAERQLFHLFKSIDRDDNGQLDKEELQVAFQRAGLAVPLRRLGEFFENIDQNNDGYISFDEWRQAFELRNFLLFMPNTDPTATLHAVFTFYADIVTLNAEGDSVVSDETLAGVELASPPPPSSAIRTQSPATWTSPPSSEKAGSRAAQQATSRRPPKSAEALFDMAAIGRQHHAQAANDGWKGTTGAKQVAKPSKPTTTDQGNEIEAGLNKEAHRSVLIQILPDPGYFVAGAVAGGVSRTTTAPLDRLKVYLLVNTKTDTSRVLQAAKKGQPLFMLKHAGMSFVSAAADLYRSGGLRGFFAGNGLNVAKIMPETAIRFGAYEAAKRTLARLEGHDDTSRINPYSKFVAGGVAGMTAQFCVYPLDTLKFRLQSEYVANGPRGNALLVQTFRNMYAEGGARAAYRGVTMGLLGMFPYSAIDMGTFEFLKTTYATYRAKAESCHEEDAQPGTLVTGVMGASSGAFGATVVYPLNVLRTRLQTQGTSMHPARYTGIWDVAHQTIRNEGVRGLYKGLMPNLLKVAPALSITWMVYENSKRILSLN